MGTLKQIEIKKEKEIKKEITNEAATPSPSGALLVLESEVSLSEPEQLCEALVRALAQWGAKGEATARWVVEAERLLRIDQRPLDEALEVLAWATHDDFWRPNIRSLAKFRAKYDTLRGQMQRATSVLPPTKRTLPESYRERAALLEEAGD